MIFLELENLALFRVFSHHGYGLLLKSGRFFRSRTTTLPSTLFCRQGHRQIVLTAPGIALNGFWRRWEEAFEKKFCCSIGHGTPRRAHTRKKPISAPPLPAKYDAHRALLKDPFSGGEREQTSYTFRSSIRQATNKLEASSYKSSSAL